MSDTQTKVSFQQTTFFLMTIGNWNRLNSVTNNTVYAVYPLILRLYHFCLAECFQFLFTTSRFPIFIHDFKDLVKVEQLWCWIPWSNIVHTDLKTLVSQNNTRCALQLNNINIFNLKRIFEELKWLTLL